MECDQIQGGRAKRKLQNGGHGSFQRGFRGQTPWASPCEVFLTQCNRGGVTRRRDIFKVEAEG